MVGRNICRLGLAVVPGMLAAWTAALAGGPPSIIDELNNELAAMAVDVRISKIELLATSKDVEAGQTIIASDRGNKQLDEDFVPGDPRRGGLTDITWIIDTVDVTPDVATAAQGPAIQRAMATWDAVRCSEIPLTEFGPFPFPVDVGVVQFLVGLGGSPVVVADVMHAGFLPAPFFDLLVSGGSTSIIGATATFTFVSTDIDGNGKPDVAFREIYYNDGFPWGIDADLPLIDVESVALHEGGHGLSQAHFGNVFINPRSMVIFAPRAVMNAVYSGRQQTLTGTDNGGHCSNWANWPQN